MNEETKTMTQETQNREEFIMLPTVDFCFKELMQNARVRQGMIAALLGVEPEEIEETILLPTILHTEYPDDKYGILDVKVMLKNETQMDFEMQVTAVSYWTKRILFYLGKMYTDQLKAGESYDKLKKCIHVGILDFIHFPDDDRCYRKIIFCDKDTGKEYTEYTENNSENEDREQTSYTWKYAPDIGWQLWSVDENNEESLCSPGVYALEDGIYYIKMYRVQEEDPDGEEVWQPVLAKGSAEITEETPVISEQNTEGKLAAGTYYYFYELDDTKENAHPEQGRYLTDTWVHPGEDPTVWYFANADGLLENPQNHAGPMHNEEGYFYLDAQGKSQAGTFEVDGIRYTYDGNGNRYQIRDGWQKENETWYYIENGSPMTGWKQIQGSWYYLDPADGSMKTGFFQDSSGTLYYTDAAGRMLSGNGWKQIRGNWYWVQPSGAIARGWKQNRGTWYYLVSWERQTKKENTASLRETSFLSENRSRL